MGYFKNRRIKKRAAELAHVLKELHCGDILLLHTKSSIIGALIRKFTKSYWNHTALVLTNFSHLPEYKTTVVIEAQDDGVMAHRIGMFLDPKKYDIAVKRVLFLDDTEQDMVKHYLLSHIDVPYDSARIFNILAGMFIGKTYSQLMNTRQVICSSLIQKAFYYAVPAEKKSEVVFVPKFKSETDLELTSPADIARSDKAAWIYNPRGHH